MCDILRRKVNYFFFLFYLKLVFVPANRIAYSFSRSRFRLKTREGKKNDLSVIGNDVEVDQTHWKRTNHYTRLRTRAQNNIDITKKKKKIITRFILSGVFFFFFVRYKISITMGLLNYPYH